MCSLAFITVRMHRYRSVARVKWYSARRRITVLKHQIPLLHFTTGRLDSNFPDAEIARQKAEHLPPQAQHLIFDAAFQRGNAGKWFELPFVIVQVIPSIASDHTKIKRLPTEAEFQQLVSLMSNGRVVSEIMKKTIDAVPNPEDKAYMNSLLASLSKPSVQVDVPSRKFWLVTDGNDPDAGPVKIYNAGTFMPDGNCVVIRATTKASRFKEDLGQFLVITRSLRKTPNL